MTKLLEKHNISLPEYIRKVECGDKTEDHDEICHALKVRLCSKLHAFVIESWASNNMVSSRESFSSLHLTKDASIHMGDETKIRDKWKGSIKLKHEVFKYVLYVLSLGANLLFIYQMTHNGPPKREVFCLDSVEISDISSANIIMKYVANNSSKEYEFSQSLL